MASRRFWMRPGPSRSLSCELRIAQPAATDRRAEAAVGEDAGEFVRDLLPARWHKQRRAGNPPSDGRRPSRRFAARARPHGLPLRVVPSRRPSPRQRRLLRARVWTQPRADPKSIPPRVRRRRVLAESAKRNDRLDQATRARTPPQARQPVHGVGKSGAPQLEQVRERVPKLAMTFCGFPLFYEIPVRTVSALNVREHWAKRAKRVKGERMAACALTPE